VLTEPDDAHGPNAPEGGSRPLASALKRSAASTWRARLFAPCRGSFVGRRSWSVASRCPSRPRAPRSPRARPPFDGRRPPLPAIEAGLHRSGTSEQGADGTYLPDGSRPAQQGEGPARGEGSQAVGTPGLSRNEESSARLAKRPWGPRGAWLPTSTATVARIEGRRCKPRPQPLAATGAVVLDDGHDRGRRRSLVLPRTAPVVVRNDGSRRSQRPPGGSGKSAGRSSGKSADSRKGGPA
jgi:hypothetical protein